MRIPPNILSEFVKSVEQAETAPATTPAGPALPVDRPDAARAPIDTKKVNAGLTESPTTVDPVALGALIKLKDKPQELGRELCHGLFGQHQAPALRQALAPLDKMIAASDPATARSLGFLLGPPGTPIDALVALMPSVATYDGLADKEHARTTLCLMVLRPEPGQKQARIDKLIDAASERGLRWTDLADYFDRKESPDIARMLDQYAHDHGLPLLQEGH